MNGFFTFLTILSIITLIVLSAMLIISKITKRQNFSRGKYIGFAMIALIVFAIFGTITEPDTSAGARQTEPNKSSSVKHSSKRKRNSSKKNSVAKMNAAYAEQLKQDQGWADGTLDENGKPTDNGTPDSDFNFSKYITKITYNENESVSVYLNNDAKNLSTKEKDQLGSDTSGFVTGVRATEQNISEKQAHDGTVMNFYCDGDYYGHTKTTNYHRFTWNK